MARRPMSTPGVSTGEVFQLIKQGHAATRSDVARLTGLSRTAVTLRVDQLLSQALLVEREEGGSTGGRPPVRLEFNADGGVVLAASLGASRAQVAVCDLAGRVLAEMEHGVDLSEGPLRVLASTVKHLDHLLAESGRAERDLRGIGVSVPGAVDVRTGRSVSPPVQPGWGDIAIGEVFAERFDVPIRVDNDVNVLALAEHHLHRDVDDLLVIKASTGIGAGIVAGGSLIRGALGASGEIGHIRVADGPGIACRCGNTDCLEAIAGGAALARCLTELGKPAGDALGVARLVQSDDPDATRLVREAGRRIGEVMAVVVNVLNPALIVIGGDLAHAYAPLVAGIREVVYQRSTAMATRSLRIEPSARDERAGVANCAIMLLRDVLSARAVDALTAADRR